MSFAMQNPRKLFITGFVLKPDAIVGGVSKKNPKNWTPFCLVVNEFSLSTTVLIYYQNRRQKC